jgi:hypothetical protein
VSEVQVVRGEMQPWTDQTTHQPAVAALLADVLPANRRTLILGPHSPLLIESVLAHSSDVTILVRSVSDAEQLSSEFGPCLQVVAGALDGLKSEPFEVIVAVDGLDRVLGYDSEDLSWTARLSALSTQAAPDAAVVLGLENEFSLLNLLDRRPVGERHGDDEWRPLHDDPTRPVSVDQLKASLPWDAQVYANFASHTLVAASVAAEARPGELPTRLAVEALEAADIPLLSPVAEGVDSAARAGLLGAIPTAWLAVCGVPTAPAIYTQTGPAVLTATPTPGGWQLSTTAGSPAADASPAATPPASPVPPARTLDSSSGAIVFDASVVRAEVPNGLSVESILFRLAAAEDVPGFRKLAARLGEWAGESRVVLRWDDVVMDGDSFAHGVSPWVAAEPVERVDLLAAAWQRFHDRLTGQHRRHPWPPWMVGDDLVYAWLGMSGVYLVEPVPATSPDTPPTSAEQVARGKELAAALAVALETREHAEVDARTALAEAEQARHELFELKGHVYGLERTLGFRDKALKTRENRIRELRTQVQKTTAERDRIRGSRTYTLARFLSRAAQIRNPRTFAKKSIRHLRRTIRLHRR